MEDYFLAAIIALWGLVWFLLKRGNGIAEEKKKEELENALKQLEEMHAIITQRDDQDRPKAHFPVKPIEDLMTAVEKIDVKQLERTHESSKNTHEELGHLIIIVKDIRRHLENKSGRSI